LADQRDLAVTKATLEQLARKASRAREPGGAGRKFSGVLVRDSVVGGSAEKSAAANAPKKRWGFFANRWMRSNGTPWAAPRGRPLPSAWRRHFRATRRAGKKARRTGKDADFHEWRKNAKRLLYQLEINAGRPGDGEWPAPRNGSRSSRTTSARTTMAWWSRIVSDGRFPFPPPPGAFCVCWKRGRRACGGRTWEIARDIEVERMG